MTTTGQLFGAEEALAAGLGVLRRTSFASPGAGADYDRAIPGGSVHLVLNWRHRLVTSAVVGNRSVVLRVNDGTTTLYEFPPAATVAASSDFGQNWTPGIGAFLAGITPGAQNSPLPPSVWLPGWHVLTVSTGLDGGDQFSQVVLWSVEVPLGNLERWLRESVPGLDEEG